MRRAGIKRRAMISEPLLHRMKILVVDDDRITVTLLEQLLQRHGYSRVMGVTDSREVLENLRCLSSRPDFARPDHAGDGRICFTGSAPFRCV